MGDDEVNKKIREVIKTLEELKEDDISVPRNVKTRIDEAIAVLQEDNEISFKINKALDMLEEAGDDVNLQAFTRTQIWNIVGLMESLQRK